MATNSNSSFFRNRTTPAAGGNSSEKTEKPAREPRTDHEDRPKRAYTKSSDNSDRPKRAYTKSDSSDRPARSFDKSDRPARPYADRSDRPSRDDKGRFAPRGEGRPYSDRSDRSDRPARSFDKSDRPARPYADRSDRSDRPARSFDKSDRPARPYADRSDRSDRPARSFDKSDRPARPYADRSDRPARDENGRFAPRGEGRPYSDRSDRPARSFDKSDRPAHSFDKSERPSGPFDKKPYQRTERPEYTPRTSSVPDWVKESAPKSQAVRQEEREAIIAEARADRKLAAFEAARAASKADAKKEKLTEGVGPKAKNENVRLNRFIAQSGICSRREADSLIAQGHIKVNGEVVKELGVKVNPSIDSIEYEGKQLSGEKLVYIIMNKPKGYVTSVEDPHNDLTVMTILGDKVKERVYPVGRLDKHTTGVLLFTNDGELTMKLTHPSFEQRKIYHAFLDKPCTVEHLSMLANGIELEDGEIHADEVSFVDGNKKEVGVEIHSGRNRIVRRMFEHLDYRVVKLDRVFFAGFTKLGLRRGYWRYLSPKEIITLRNL